MLISHRKVPNRDDKYMGLAHWIASFSKDPNTQVGAIIIDTNGKPKGIGFNGPPTQINDEKVNWERPFKYDFIIHSEDNAIKHSSGDLEGSTLYVTAKPCSHCMLKIVSAGIKRVVYFPFKNDSGSMLNTGISDKSSEIAQLGHVQLVEYKGNLNWMRDRIQFMEECGVFG